MKSRLSLFGQQATLDEQLNKLDQVNSYGLVSKVFDATENDMEHIEHTIEVHGTI